MSCMIQVETYHTEVERIVRDVLLTMTSYETHPSNEQYAPSKDRLTCAVFFAGSWKGGVIIECPLAMGFEFTSRLMRIPAPESFNDDVCDALGELANMIGGNLKSVLPPGSSLSIPTVVEGSHYSLRICGQNRNERMAFVGLDGPFWVTLVEIEN